MATMVSSVLMRQLGELRIEPTQKRVRASVDGVAVLDSRRALLVWEPRRVVPTYAVPVEDVFGVLMDSPTSAETSSAADSPVWDPRVPFAVRTTSGRAVTVASSGSASIEGFVADDPDLEGYVIVDFDGPDNWREDEDEIMSHPHDPFSRIDIRTSSQHVEMALDGEVIADSSRSRILYETGLSPRYYLPREDVVAELRPSPTITTCAYKGRAEYFSPVVAGKARDDLAWSYPTPLTDAEGVTGLIAFFDEKLDVTIDEVRRLRPTTPWS